MSLAERKRGSSPCLRLGLRPSKVGHYALLTVVCISQTVCHALNQLDLSVKSLGHPVAVAALDFSLSAAPLAPEWRTLQPAPSAEPANFEA
jgi:hypothetical protein